MSLEEALAANISALIANTDAHANLATVASAAAKSPPSEPPELGVALTHAELRPLWSKESAAPIMASIRASTGSVLAFVPSDWATRRTCSGFTRRPAGDARHR